MKINLTYTVNKKLIPDYYNEVLSCYGLSAKNNRTMYNFPHAKFIEILKYKALLKDIVVIEVEESYTSKTSFIDNEELRVFNKYISKELNDSEGKDLTQGDENQLSKSNNKKVKVKLIGKRINQKFITKK